MPSPLQRLALLAGAVLASAQVLAVPFPDEHMGPPSYSLMGCPHDKVWTRDVVRDATGLSNRVLERIERRFKFDPARVCASDPWLIEGFVNNASHPKHRFDEPDMALEQRAKQLRDENGQIPPDALLNALAQRQTMLPPPPPPGSYLALAAGISNTSWTWLGPGNIGGRVRAISPNPSTPGDILIGSVSGGLWRTFNSGVSWNVIDDFMPNVAISTLARDPGNSQVVYAGTGEGVFNIDAVRGLGIFKSVTSGATWSQLSSTNPSTAGTDWYYVNRIAISPTDSNVMLAATNGGLYRTTNAGATWTKVYQAVGTNRWRSVMDVTFHPTDGNIALLGEAQHFNCLSTCAVDGNGVAYSSDGGATWTRTKLNTSAITGSAGRVEVAISKSNPSIAYASVNMASGQLYKSTDGGATWTPNAPVSTPAHMGTQGWYNNALWVAPNDPNRVIVGGVTMKLSTNGGSTWGATGNTVHVDHHAFVSDPNYASNNTIFNGNDGGVYKATAANTATPVWSNLNNNLGITQFYGGAGKLNGRITGGTQDNGTLLWAGTTDWIQIWGSDGGNSAADQSDGNYVYGMTQYGGIIRYTQALASNPPANASQYICSGITDASCNFNNASPTILFIPPIAIDRNTNTTMFLGARQLWRSTNIKAATNTAVSWSVVKPQITSGAYISEVAVAPGNSDLVWIGYENGGLACTTNATAASPTWVTVTGGASRYVTRISFDPSNTNRVFVSNGGYATGNLRLTTSGCTATPVWTQLHVAGSNQIPAAPIRAVAVHPGNPAWLYAGTEIGIFTSENGGSTWSTTNDGPGTVSVEELFWLDNTTLVAATHGRGMFRATVAPGDAPQFTSAPPPSGIVNVAYTHNYTANGNPSPTFVLTSGTLPPGLTLAAGGELSGAPTTPGTFTGVVTATNASGTANQAFSIQISGGEPGYPTIGTATPGNQQATIQFFPGPQGASAVTHFTVSCTPSGSAQGPSSPITVTGLTNGTTYSCSVRATNSFGTGPASGTVNVTPGIAPVFTSGAAPGGSFGTPYGHTFTTNSTPAATYAVTSGALPSGLTLNGSSGAVSGTPSAAGTFNGVVTATNSVGSATQGFSIAIAAVVPGAPTLTSAAAGVGQATLNFSPPASNGGSGISSYTGTCNPGNVTASSATSPIVVPGLAGGVTYTCFVHANNAVGAGAASNSANVTPTGAPVITSAPPGPGGTGTPYSHQYTASGAPAPTFALANRSNLPPGVTLSASGTMSGTPTAAGTYTGAVDATNSAGTATQAYSITITAGVPGAPTIGSATPGNGQLTISFSPPASNGGSAITSYRATCNPGGAFATGAGSPITVTGLTNGVGYTCSVAATNSAGTGPSSGTVAGTPGAGPAFTSAAAPGGTFGAAYSHTFSASGAPAPTFTVTSGALPGGLSLDAASGALTGTPNAVGTFNGVVTASNASGSATQAFSIAIAAAVPGAPTIGAATPGNGQATIAFSAPASNGGAAITSYTASCTPGPVSASGAGSPITVTGLSNGTTYSCSVRATNSAGTSAASGTVTVTPLSAPAITSAPPPGGTFGVGYSHTYAASGSPAPTFSVTSGSLPVGLSLAAGGALVGTPNATGTFTGVVTATNSSGTATQAFSITIVATVPSAPTIGAATPGNGQATINFTGPASNGGSPVTSYTATCNPGAIAASGAGSPIVVGGLTNGVAYSCSVRATNAIGTGSASSTVGVTPGIAPFFTSAVPGNGTFGVAYSHTFAASGAPAPTFSLTSGALPSGLALSAAGALSGTPNAAGSFSGIVTATNSLGTATQGFTITISPTVPDAPTIGSVSAGNAQATVSFTAPVSNGGSPITGYVATCTPGPVTAGGAASPITVTGLANGTTYACSVAATNAAGTGASSASLNVTPSSVAPPVFTSGAAPNGSFNVPYAHTFTASGSPAPTFAVTSGALPTGLTLDGSTGALTGTPTAAGTFSGQVTATSSSGTASQGFAILIAATVPGAPTIGTVTAGNKLLTLSFAAPASNGGSPITSYLATCNPGPSTASGSGSPITLTGLSNGTTYTCSVQAINAIGAGPASGTVTGRPGNSPRITSAAPPNGTVGVAFSHTFTSDGSPPLTFAVTSGVLPPGLSLDGTTGVLSGTPAAAGTYPASVTVSNGTGSEVQAFTIVIRAPSALPTIGGCNVFPAGNYWNTPVDTLPVHPSSAAWVASVGNSAQLRAEWSRVLSENKGIPFVTVTGTQPLVPVAGDPQVNFSSESDPGPYPIPADAPIEGGPAGTGDRHVVVVETTNCVLYELFNAKPVNGGASWTASSFAKWPLGSNALRPRNWISADYAGLPVFPGLVRWEEVAAGEIAHALRFTAEQIWGRDAATNGIKYTWPARHNAGTETNPAFPPMGARFRLKANFDITPYSEPTRVILRAFKKYGLVLADSGTNWGFQGVSSTSWPDSVFTELGSIHGSNFEAVDTSLMMVDPDSALATLPQVTGSLAVRYRLYNPFTLEHLYTTDLNEYNVLQVCCAWIPEGAIYRLFAGPGSYNGIAAVPYYRLYNPFSHQHHWTTDANEYNALPGFGWSQEGIDGYILPTQASGTVALHRLYLEAAGGLHLWTTDMNEVSHLTTNGGWVYEGIAGYVVPMP